MIVVVKCRGEEAGNMLLRQTRRSTHNNRRALVNVHDDAHPSRCCLSKGKVRFSLDRTIECRRAARLNLKKAKKCESSCAGKPALNVQSISQSRGVAVGTKYGEAHSAGSAGDRGIKEIL